jgi:Arc/MetJ-type ribon-helix-helix transcriptional regulator
MGESQKPTTVGITPSFLRKIDDHVDRFSYGTRNAFVLEAIRNQIRHDERHPSRAPLSTVREAIRVIMSSGGYFTAKFITKELKKSNYHVSKRMLYQVLNGGGRISREIKYIGKRKRVYYELKK